MEAVWISTGLVALAEIGDKTQLLAMLLATRFRKPGRSDLAWSSTSTSLPVSINPQVEALTNRLSD